MNKILGMLMFISVIILQAVIGSNLNEIFGNSYASYFIIPIAAFMYFSSLKIMCE